MDSSSTNSEAAQSLVNSFDHSVSQNQSWNNAYKQADGITKAFQESKTYSDMAQHVAGAQESASQILTASRGTSQGEKLSARDMALNALAHHMSAADIMSNAYSYADNNNISPDVLRSRINAAMQSIQFANHGQPLTEADRISGILMGLIGAGGNGSEFGIQNGMFNASDATYGGLSRDAASISAGHIG
ncbi:MAG: hypothetical protein ACYCY8_07115, partial [Burkholderiales bacterium]